MPVVPDRGDRHGHREDGPVFAPPEGLAVGDALAAPDLAEDLLDLTDPVRRAEDPDRPTISSAVYPYMCSAAGFQVVITPSTVFPMMASSDEVTIAARRSAGASGSR
jgi:hypothetical protein